MPITKNKQQCQTRMTKSIDALKHDLAKHRTGRAHPSLLEQVMVPYYGNDTLLNQVANVTASDARTLQVTPWEKDLVQAIEKAIRESNLNLNPRVSGQVIHVPLPPLTEERRRELAKLVKSEGENAKVSIRNVRRDANQHLKDLLKDKEVSEDDEHRAQDDIQKMTDKFTQEIDSLISAKEADLMEV